MCEGLRARIPLRKLPAPTLMTTNTAKRSMRRVSRASRDSSYVAMRAMREVKSLMTNVMAKWKIVSQCVSACESFSLRVMILCMHTRRFALFPRMTPQR